MATQDLFKEFWEDFIIFEQKHFNMLIKDVTRLIREYLRENRVWIRNEKSYSIARSLYDCAKSERD